MRRSPSADINRRTEDRLCEIPRLGVNIPETNQPRVIQISPHMVHTRNDNPYHIVGGPRYSSRPATVAIATDHAIKKPTKTYLNKTNKRKSNSTHVTQDNK